MKNLQLLFACALMLGINTATLMENQIVAAIDNSSGDIKAFRWHALADLWTQILCKAKHNQ